MNATAPAFPALHIPPNIDDALAAGATLAVSISSGKDGQAALMQLSRARRARRWPGPFLAIHADLGRAEWSHTDRVVREQAEAAGAELVIVRRTDGLDLPGRIEREAKKHAGTGRKIWPSSKARYCTSDTKRDPILTALRRCTTPIVISVQGLRAQESQRRAKKPRIQIEKRITAKRLKTINALEILPKPEKRERLVLNWLAVQNYDIEDVWNSCGTTGADLERRKGLYNVGRHTEALDGWPCDPVYVMGNQRKSCSICVIACINDMINGALHHPEYARTLLDIERRSGQTFKPKLSIASVIDQAEARRSNISV